MTITEKNRQYSAIREPILRENVWQIICELNFNTTLTLTQSTLKFKNIEAHQVVVISNNGKIPYFGHVTCQSLEAVLKS